MGGIGGSLIGFTCSGLPGCPTRPSTGLGPGLESGSGSGSRSRSRSGGRRWGGGVGRPWVYVGWGEEVGGGGGGGGVGRPWMYTLYGGRCGEGEVWGAHGCIRCMGGRDGMGTFLSSFHPSILPCLRYPYDILRIS